MKIRSGPYFKEQKTDKGRFSYADASIVCGEPQFHDKFRDVLLNPTAIIEILSESTEGFDRGEKFRRYLTHIPFLQDYALVHQTLPWIQVYSRHPDFQSTRSAIIRNFAPYWKTIARFPALMMFA